MKDTKTVKPVKTVKKEIKRKVFMGKIISTKNINTVRISIERFVQHPIYGKPIRKTNTVMAHNEKLTLAVGDVVWIEACRPMSKMKHFIVTEKV